MDCFSLHANTWLAPRDRERLEALCRYAAHPAVSESRLAELPDGRIGYSRKRRWAVAARVQCARAAGTRRNGAGDRCVRAVAAGLTGSGAGGRIAVVGPGWSGTGAWTSYARSSARRSRARRLDCRRATRGCGTCSSGRCAWASCTRDRARSCPRQAVSPMCPDRSVTHVPGCTVGFP
ncbi:MAG: transposase [Planctomycetota bacterium]